MPDINLKAELEKAQVELSQNAIVREVQQLLNADAVNESLISDHIYNKSISNGVDSVIAELLNPSLIFDIEAVEAICTKYRLQFLDSTSFKGGVPAEAIRKVKHIESSTGLRFTKFRVMALAGRFRLKTNKKDPMLFAELPNGRFYFICQWDDALNLSQRLLQYPYRHMGILAAISIPLGALIALLVPMQFTDGKAEFFYRFLMFSMSSALIMTLAIITGIMYSKDFSKNVWNNKFLP